KGHVGKSTGVSGKTWACREKLGRAWRSMTEQRGVGQGRAGLGMGVSDRSTTMPGKGGLRAGPSRRGHGREAEKMCKKVIRGKWETTVVLLDFQEVRLSSFVFRLTDGQRL
ncbi:hypothetical protein Dimus_033152, partial [Dionaea muscipula]